jgi:hypothetical protein
MQFESKHVYQEVTRKKGEDLAYVEALGNFVQKALADELRGPRKLIISLKGIGRWFLRKKVMEDSYNRISKLNPHDFIPENKENTQERHELWQNYLKTLKERLDDYIPFLERKQDARNRKNEWKESQDNA